MTNTYTIHKERARMNISSFTLFGTCRHKWELLVNKNTFRNMNISKQRNTITCEIGIANILSKK
jgi:hypothetical protein